MTVFQINGKADTLEFTNYDRINEEALFNDVMDKLKRNPDIAIGEKRMGPSEDVYKCTIGKELFTLWYDIDYGPSIHSKSVTAIEKLTIYFNN